MNKNGISVKRSTCGNYRGYTIIKETITEHDYFLGLYRSWGTQSVNYTFCAEGDEKRPSKHYIVNGAKTIKAAKDCIDKMLDEDAIYFTEEERQKYVWRPNKKCEWAYGYTSLMKIMRDHQKADKRIKMLLEDRLVDANFHTEAGMLSECDYKGFEDYVTRTYPFSNEMKLVIKTQRKPLKDVDFVLEELKSVIANYLKENGIDGEVKIKKCV